MPAAVFAVKKFLAFWLCYIAGQLIAEGAVILLHFALGKNIFKGEMFDAQTITLITYYGYIIIAAVPLVYWKLVEKKPLAEMGLTGRFANYFAGAAAGVLLLAASVFAIILSGGVEFRGLFRSIDVGMILLLFGGFVVQGAAEEFLCRGMVLHSLKEKTSLGLAVAVSTLVFVLPHCSSLFGGGAAYGLVGTVDLVLISVIFSMLTVHFKSVWAACGLHSFWNVALYCVFGLNLSGNQKNIAAVFDMRSVEDNLINGGGYGIEASIITTAVLAAAAAFLIFRRAKKTPHIRSLDLCAVQR